MAQMSVTEPKKTTTTEIKNLLWKHVRNLPPPFSIPCETCREQHSAMTDCSQSDTFIFNRSLEVAARSPMKPYPLCFPVVGSRASMQDLILPKASNTLLMSSSDKSGCTDATYIRLKARASSANWSMIGWAWPMLLGRPTYKRVLKQHSNRILKVHYTKLL